MLPQRSPKPRFIRSLLTGLSALTLLVAGIAVAGPALAQTTDTVNATATALSVRVSGNQIVDANGNTVVLRGVNKSGPEYMCQQGGIFDNGSPGTDADIALMKSWGVNFVRVPLSEVCWLDNKISWSQYTGATYRNTIVDYVNRLNANGIYTAVDLHFTDPNVRAAGEDSWGVQDAAMANTHNSLPFWTSVANTFKNNKAMIFELYNEPHDIKSSSTASWQCLRDGCDMGFYKAAGNQQMLNAIRATGATNPVIANGLDWGNDMSRWLEFAPTDPAGQLIAGQHLYNFKDRDSVAEWNAEFKPVMAQYPILATEIGLGENKCTASNEITDFMKWMDANGGDGFAVWTFGRGDCPAGNPYGGAALLNWDSTPTTFGAAVKAYILSKQGSNTTPPAPTTTTPPTTPTTQPTTSTTTQPTTSTSAPTTTTTTSRPPTTTTTTPPGNNTGTETGAGDDGGYRVVTAAGVVTGFGTQSATFGNAPSGSNVVGIANTQNGGGYWLATSTGRVFNLGNAPAYGDFFGKALNAPIVAMTMTDSGRGYWLLGADGGIFSFGDAQFYGSTGDRKLNAPVVSMTATPSGGGYWFVAADGGIFSFGDAQFYGSTGNIILNKPVVGMAANPAGFGYWLVASDGGVFAFGDVQFYGSTGNITLNQPIIGISATAKGDGYRFVASDGGVFNFGAARYVGSLGETGTPSPVRSITS